MRPTEVPVLLILFLGACLGGGKDDDDDDDDDLPYEPDSDGYSIEDGDCDDQDSSIHPGAEEICDGVDQDCDGEIDEGVLGTWYTDDDADGVGGDQSSEACEPAQGEVWVGGDCDDADATTYPGAAEACGDLRDSDCDGTPDEGCALEGDVPTSAAYATWTGSDDHGAVLALGDLDADGTTDLVTGEPAFAARLLWGPATPGDHDATTSDLVDGDADSAGLGTGVALGDFDLDGTPDLAVGAANTSSWTDTRGEVFLLRGGARGDLAPADAWASVTGNSADYLGYGLDAGDLDGDGDTDLVMGAMNDEQVGTFAVLLAPVAAGARDVDDADATWLGDQPNEFGGRHPAVAGDTDGDGIADLLAGGYGYDGDDGSSGRAWLVRGPVVPGTLTTHTTFVGEATGYYAGYAVSGAGDVNGDGYGDVVIGGYGWRQNSSTTMLGRAWVLYGPTPEGPTNMADAPTIVSGTGQDDACGLGVAGGGDLDGDGNDDLAVACSYVNEPGSISLFYGPVAAGAFYHSQADARIAGEYGAFGETMRFAPDLTGDGLDDLLVAAPSFDEGGRVYLYAGSAR